jgi:type II secretory pathway component PulF
MLFKYTVINQSGAEQEGTIEAVSEDSAIATLQRNRYVITRIEPADKKSGWQTNITWFEGVSSRDIVILSRQLATLFGAQVSALRIFRLIGTEAENPVIRRVLTTVADDIQGGLPISKALSKHPTVFSPFYCNMVLAGEETGRLEQTFDHLADYLDRSYAVTSKAKHALVYPAFIIGTFLVVFVLMLTFVIPQLTSLIKDAGTDIPVYTKVVMAISDVFREYGFILFGFLALVAFGVFRYANTKAGQLYMDQMKLDLPLFGELYRKLYLSRIADNMSTMLSSGIAMVQALEITSAVVENSRFERVIEQAREDLKNGASIAQAFSSHPEIPAIMIQMIRVGEESGELSNILMTLSKFYSRELENTVDTITSLIEPIMIIALAGGVGVLLASVLLPIYSITTSIS